MYPILGRHDSILPMGIFQDHDKSYAQATTCILTLKPNSRMHLGKILLAGQNKDLDPEDLEILFFTSEKRRIIQQPNKSSSSSSYLYEEAANPYMFPLRRKITSSTTASKTTSTTTSSTSTSIKRERRQNLDNTHTDPQQNQDQSTENQDQSTEPFLCIQGHNGSYTHHEAPNMFALDFACEKKTEVVAIADGVVLKSTWQHKARGHNIEFLFTANHVTLILDDGNIAEYVHIDSLAKNVTIGTRVRKGDLIAYSGDSGFAPAPHLHLELHSSLDPESASILYKFESKSGEVYIPIAGGYYDHESGPVPNRSWALEAAESLESDDLDDNADKDNPDNYQDENDREAKQQAFYEMANMNI
eukprot:CAMPEP_0197543608 /NCGR_PEP_ID=MMETSP1318-20131121/68334_1 /TAXON_ID=552666 /ORGANISM="Partenskyella glossopodia, Strain RCC365" /LENGTH=358 /DNA_ID=CAMNT_0043102961 /DNA_START=1828 /DNA_END=2904 /DNA_ORIENTATION=-